MFLPDPHHLIMASSQIDLSIFEEMENFFTDARNWGIAAVGGFMSFKTLMAVVAYIFKR